MLEFSLIILVGISSSCDAFEASKFFYHFNKILLRNMIKSKYFYSLLIFLCIAFIAKILGCLRYFDKAFRVGSLKFSTIESV